MSNPKGRTKEENLREIRRLHEMYNRLPPDKQKAMRPHMQSRIDKLNAAIAGLDRKASKSPLMGLVQGVLLATLVGLIALGAGFFGVSYLMAK